MRRLPNTAWIAIFCVGAFAAGLSAVVTLGMIGPSVPRACMPGEHSFQAPRTFKTAVRDRLRAEGDVIRAHALAFATARRDAIEMLTKHPDDPQTLERATTQLAEATNALQRVVLTAIAEVSSAAPLDDGVIGTDPAAAADCIASVLGVN